MRLTLTLVAISAAALPSLANWDARFFPTTNAPTREWDGTNVTYAQDVIVTQMIAAVNERYWAIGSKAAWSQSSIANDAAITLRKPEQVLGICKTGTVALLGYYLDMSRMTNGPNELVYWNETNILAACNLPTNFFRYVPVRNLMEYDTPVQDGWTNSIGYGWEAMRAVIAKLTNTYQVEGILQNQTVDESWASISEETISCPPPKECGYVENRVGPLLISDLYVTNIVAGVTYVEKYGASEYYTLADPFNNKFYETYEISGSGGYLAAYIGPPTSPLRSRAHTAKSYFKGLYSTECMDLSDPKYANCGFTNSTQWAYFDTITSVASTADQHWFIYGDDIGPADPACSICLLVGEYDPEPGGNTETISCGDDIVDVDVFIGGSIRLTCLADSGLRNETEYSHIITWDFLYK